MKTTVLFFATLRDRSGKKSVQMDLPDGTTVKRLKSLLAEEYPKLSGILPTVLVSIDREYAFDDQTIPDGAEVALFPPVSGGGGDGRLTFCSITEESIDLNNLLEKITFETTGAAAIFTGMVRAKTFGEGAHETQYLEYEAYKPMAESKMNQVAEEIRSRWPTIEGIAIIQRIGHLQPRTPTVMIACTAAHRDTGVFEAARYGIDRLKEIVPIWKKEVGPGGEFWVEGEYHPEPGE